MAKVTSLLGGLRGKASNMVFAKTGGSVIMREYNPTVSNPNTEAQVGQRSKFKLMSQLSAAMADVIVIPKQGLVSARNRFMQINMPLATEVNGTAQVTYENLQLTDGNLGLPGIYANREDADSAYIELTEAASANINRVVYCIFKKTSEELLQLVATAIVSIAGDDNKFRVSGLTLDGEIVIFAYGMRDLDAAASAKYGSYSIASGEDIARLVANRSISASDYKFTKTRGATLVQGETSTETLGADQVRVYATASNGGSVSGGGVYTIGDQVNLVATPATGYQFVKWIANGDSTQAALSTDQNWQFEAQATVDVIALFEASEVTDPILTINKSFTGTLAISYGSGNSVESGAAIPVGTTLSISATPSSSNVLVAKLNGVDVALAEDEGSYVGTFQMPAANATLSVSVSDGNE